MANTISSNVYSPKRRGPKNGSYFCKKCPPDNSRVEHSASRPVESHLRGKHSVPSGSEDPFVGDCYRGTDDYYAPYNVNTGERITTPSQPHQTSLVATPSDDISDIFSNVGRQYAMPHPQTFPTLPNTQRNLYEPQNQFSFTPQQTLGLGQPNLGMGRGLSHRGRGRSNTLPNYLIQSHARIGVMPDQNVRSTPSQRLVSTPARDEISDIFSMGGNSVRQNPIMPAPSVLSRHSRHQQFGQMHMPTTRTSLPTPIIDDGSDIFSNVGPYPSLPNPSFHSSVQQQSVLNTSPFLQEGSGYQPIQQSPVEEEQSEQVKKVLPFEDWIIIKDKHETDKWTNRSIERGAGLQRYFQEQYAEIQKNKESLMLPPPSGDEKEYGCLLCLATAQMSDLDTHDYYMDEHLNPASAEFGHPYIMGNIAHTDSERADLIVKISPETHKRLDEDISAVLEQTKEYIRDGQRFARGQDSPFKSAVKPSVSGNLTRFEALQATDTANEYSGTNWEKDKGLTGVRLLFKSLQDADERLEEEMAEKFDHLPGKPKFENARQSRGKWMKDVLQEGGSALSPNAPSPLTGTPAAFQDHPEYDPSRGKLDHPTPNYLNNMASPGGEFAYHAPSPQNAPYGLNRRRRYSTTALTPIAQSPYAAMSPTAHETAIRKLEGNSVGTPASDVRSASDIHSIPDVRTPQGGTLSFHPRSQYQRPEQQMERQPDTSSLLQPNRPKNVHDRSSPSSGNSSDDGKLDPYTQQPIERTQKPDRKKGNFEQ